LVELAVSLKKDDYFSMFQSFAYCKRLYMPSQLQDFLDETTNFGGCMCFFQQVLGAFCS